MFFKRKLKAIGYWYSEDEPSFPKPSHLVDVDVDLEVRHRLMGYLKSGYVNSTWRGKSWCRFGCDSNSYNMGYRDYTDGCWVWPEGLVHYVQMHGVMLPKEFIEYATSRDWKVTPSEGNQELAVCFKFWKKYAKSHKFE